MIRARLCRIGWTFWIAALLIAGCASPPRLKQAPDGTDAHWQGRLAMTIASDPVQAFSADFELAGNALAGTLIFSTALGTTLAQVQWDTAGAVLHSGVQTQRFASLQHLTQHLTGTEIPVASLFAWLQGHETAADGWQADLGELAQGLLHARRESPAPPVDLKIVLQR
ncbi:MAG: lipoprotein insertase outer membrane protein LolB [Burkholderiales bacterium]